jgi:transcriptional accessory protein Tex/SPT6
MQTNDNPTNDNPTNGAASSSPEATPMQAAPAETAPAQVAGNDGNDALTGVAAESGAAPDAAGATDVASSADAAPADVAPATTPAAEQPSGEQPGAGRPSRQFSMAQVMESDEFSSYMSGVDRLNKGTLLKGIVVRVDENTGEALVDIGTKSEGIIARNELGDEGINVGDEIEAVVMRSEDDEGHPVLSKRRADYERTWREIQQAKESEVNLEGLVREQVKGGLIVDLGVPAFVPASHVDARNRSDLSRFVGRTIPVRVIEIDRKKNKVIASHRIASAEDRERRETEVWSTLEKEKIVEGVVRRITDFGAFRRHRRHRRLAPCARNGVGPRRASRQRGQEGPEAAARRARHRSGAQACGAGPEAAAKRSVQEGREELQPRPDGQGQSSAHCSVVRFVELEEGVEGIVPISEMSNTRINKPEDVLSIGQEVEARVKQVQPNQRRITLSLKSAQQDREVRETRTAIREVNERATRGDGRRWWRRWWRHSSG